MHAHADAGAQGAAGKLVAHVQFVGRVAGLVDHAVHRGVHRVFIVVRRDAHVGLGEVRRKRMLDLAADRVLLRQPHHAHQVFGQLSLLRFRVKLIQERRVRLPPLLLDLFDQRDERRAHLAEERVERFDGHALFVFVEQRIVDRRVRLIVERKAARIVDHLFKVRQERSKIVLVLCLAPGVRRGRGLDLIRDVFLHRDAGHALARLVHALCFAERHRIHRVRLRKDRLGRLDKCRVGLQQIRRFAQRPERVAHQRRRAGRHHGFHIILHHAHRVIVYPQLFQLRLKELHRIFEHGVLLYQI